MNMYALLLVLTMIIGNSFTLHGMERGNALVTLGFASTDSPSKNDIKKKYNTLARTWHPDKNPGNPEVDKKFKEIQAAYKFLQEPIGKLSGELSVILDTIFSELYSEIATFIEEAREWEEEQRTTQLAKITQTLQTSKEKIDTENLTNNSSVTALDKQFTYLVGLLLTANKHPSQAIIPDMPGPLLTQKKDLLKLIEGANSIDALADNTVTNFFIIPHNYGLLPPEPYMINLLANIDPEIRNAYARAYATLLAKENPDTENAKKICVRLTKWQMGSPYFSFDQQYDQQCIQRYMQKYNTPEIPQPLQQSWWQKAWQYVKSTLATSKDSANTQSTESSPAHTHSSNATNDAQQSWLQRMWGYVKHMFRFT
ncbi:MAG: J domain-containing protein [Candidatus Babeliales bacterium]